MSNYLLAVISWGKTETRVLLYECDFYLCIFHHDYFLFSIMTPKEMQYYIVKLIKTVISMLKFQCFKSLQDLLLGGKNCNFMILCSVNCLLQSTKYTSVIVSDI